MRYSGIPTTSGLTLSIVIALGQTTPGFSEKPAPSFVQALKEDGIAR
jgi:hypothetical protein